MAKPVQKCGRKLRVTKREWSSLQGLGQYCRKQESSCLLRSRFGFIRLDLNFKVQVKRLRSIFWLEPCNSAQTLASCGLWRLRWSHTQQGCVKVQMQSNIIRKIPVEIHRVYSLLLANTSGPRRKQQKLVSSYSRQSIWTRILQMRGSTCMLLS